MKINFAPEAVTTPEHKVDQRLRQKVLRMVENERMGGSVPVWETVKTPKQEVTQRLAQAKNSDVPDAGFKQALADYNQETGGVNYGAAAEEFGFGDFVDMVNPLQHIPVVSSLYRGVTGDDIKPIGNIIGGALYGGALGAAGGVLNTIARHETGHDLATNAFAVVLNNDLPSLKSNNKAAPDNPEARINEALAMHEDNNQAPGSALGSALSFADLSYTKATAPKPPVKAPIKEAAQPVGYYDDGKVIFDLSKLPGREAISEVKI